MAIPLLTNALQAIGADDLLKALAGAAAKEALERFSNYSGIPLDLKPNEFDEQAATWVYKNRDQANDFSLRMRELNLKHQEHLRELVFNSGGGAEKVPMYLTFTILSAWGLMAAGLFFVNIPDKNHELVIRMQGTLDGALMTAVAFWLGSSLGSTRKNGTIADLQRRLGDEPRRVPTTRPRRRQTDPVPPEDLRLNDGVPDYQPERYQRPAEQVPLDRPGNAILDDE